LESIGLKAGCTYLSDLHYSPFYYGALIMDGVRQLRDNDYSLYEWTDAVCYITGKSRAFESVEEAIEFLRRYLCQ